MRWQTHAILIANDLNGMTARIEELPAHPKMTAALTAVQAAEKAIREATADLHHADMRARYQVEMRARDV